DPIAQPKLLVKLSGVDSLLELFDGQARRDLIGGRRDLVAQLVDGTGSDTRLEDRPEAHRLLTLGTDIENRVRPVGVIRQGLPAGYDRGDSQIRQTIATVAASEVNAAHAPSTTFFIPPTRCMTAA